MYLIVHIYLLFDFYFYLECYFLLLCSITLVRCKYICTNTRKHRKTHARGINCSFLFFLNLQTTFQNLYNIVLLVYSFCKYNLCVINLIVSEFNLRMNTYISVSHTRTHAISIFVAKIMKFVYRYLRTYI